MIGLVLGILGWLADRWSGSPRLLSDYARQLSDYYSEQDKKLSPLLEDSLFWLEIHANTTGPYNLPGENEIAFLQKWADEAIVWMLFEDSIPVFWTDNTLLLPPAMLGQLYQEQNPGIVQLNTGYYLLRTKKLGDDNAPLLLIAAIPIKKEYPVEGPHLKPTFAANLGAFPDHILIGTEGDEAVSGPDGSPLFYLSRIPGMLNRARHLLGLGLYLLAFLCFALFLNRMANAIARKYHPWLGAALIIVALAAAGLLAEWGGFRAAFADTAFFRDTSNTFIFKQSLGEFFINSLILLWLMVFFHREFQLQFQPRLLAPWPVIFTTVTYSLSIISLLVIIRIFQSLIMESDLVFDFEYIFGLDFRTLLALVSGLLIMMAVFLFNHRLLQTTSRLGSNVWTRILAALAAIVLTSPVFFALDLEISPFFVLFMAIVFVIGLDFTLDSASISLTTAVSWLVFFAICTSIMVYNFRQKQDLATQKSYALSLSDPQDQLLESAVHRLHDRLATTAGVRRLFNSTDSLLLNRDSLYALIDASFSAEPYLFQHYEFELFGISRRDDGPRLLIRGQRLGESMQLLADQADTQPTAVNGLAYWPKPNRQNFTYLLDLSPAEAPNRFLLAFRPHSPKEQRVYGDLLRSIPYKDLPQLPLYNYIIYGNLRPLKQAGKLPSSLRLPFSSLQAGEYREFYSKERSTLLYKNEHGFTVLITRSNEGILQALSLFSFLFALLVLLVILLSVLNYSWQALPNTLEFTSLNRASLRNRIQRAVLLLILGSFILVGIVTAAFFRRNALRAGSEQLNEKAQAVLADLQRNIGSQEEAVSGLQYLAPLIEPIADIHNMDINIYNLQGHLQLTSAAYLFRQQVTAPLMNPIALQALRLPTQSSYRSDEHLGDLIYQSAYVPIRDSNEEIIAYLELPYYANDRELRNDLQSFLSALLNVYVFLLLVSGAIALFVAESITQPISKIGQKLSQFRLGHNEPLEWKSPDEIGQLIAEYNLMINKLEESAEKLRQSEREGAWREMAKQVAHEIKNPLTPMKLNIQHLLRVQQQDPERASSMLSEVAQSIIQQIDGLSRIAGEFSNFAKMPQAQNEYFELNKLVYSVYQLYAKGDHGATEISLELPQQTLEVFADSTQLMRVINNLIKNALQAIPENRHGEVAIRLRQAGEKVILSVSDNGTGIPEALQDKVFFPNFTTKNSGMGLGLAMSRSIVNTAGGRIYFETEEGAGTTFFVELPAITNKEGAFLLES